MKGFKNDRDISITSNHSQLAKLGYTVVVKFWDSIEKKVMDKDGYIHIDYKNGDIIFGKEGGNWIFKAITIGTGIQKGFRISNPELAPILLQYTGNHKVLYQGDKLVINNSHRIGEEEKSDPPVKAEDISWLTDMAQRNQEQLKKQYEAKIEDLKKDYEKEIEKLNKDVEFYKDYASESEAQVNNITEELKMMDKAMKTLESDTRLDQRMKDKEEFRNSAITYLRKMITDYEDMPKIQVVNDLIDYLFL